MAVVGAVGGMAVCRGRAVWLFVGGSGMVVVGSLRVMGVMRVGLEVLRDFFKTST
ncbi:MULTISPECIES: hypothetical protein [unclassified Bartonella]|uniref:hypothetical protein n=1 Tax=unclassified Bartonella TaxID=2645622 RepID=UPI0035CE8701